MVAPGKAARTAASPSPLERAIAALAVRIGADRRDMDQRRHARRGGRLGDVARAVDMDAVEIALEDADQVDDRVARPGRRRRPRLVGEVGADELDLAEPAERLQEEGAARLALGDADPAPALNSAWAA